MIPIKHTLLVDNDEPDLFERGVTRITLTLEVPTNEVPEFLELLPLGVVQDPQR